MKRKHKTAGFTLIEILLSLIIFCALAGIAVSIYSYVKMKAYDATAQEDLRHAYYSAMAFFVENPNSTLTQPGLTQYGFQSSPNVSMSIIDGSPTSLFLLSRYKASGTGVYIIYSKGIDSPGSNGRFWMAQWIPQGESGGNPPASPLTSPSEQGGESGPKANSLDADLMGKCNLLARSVLGQAYEAAQSFFRSNPGGILTKDHLVAHGYTPHDSVNLTIIDGSAADLSMSAVFNIPGAANFEVDGSGMIIPHS
jgi:prepilin-type N-terminal cleavage/methylation domain-containing protein